MPRLRKTILFGLLVAIAGALFSFLDLAHELEENSGLGLLFKLRGIKSPPAEVVIVSIDRESSERLRLPDNPDRWPRSLHARLIDKLSAEGVSVIIFDLYFIDPRTSEEDNLLAEAIRSARNVVLAEPLKAKEIPASSRAGVSLGEHRIVESVKPIASVSKHAFATAPFVLPRLPIKVNQYWTFQTAAGDSPTFPIVAFQRYALSAYSQFCRLAELANPVTARRLPKDLASSFASSGVTRLIRDIRSVFEADASLAARMSVELERSDLGSRDPRQYALVKSLINLYGGPDHRYLNYYGPPRTLTTIPFYQVLEPGDVLPRGRPIDFKGKAVFVGLSEIALTEKKDSFYTVFSRPDGVFLSGAEIAATAFSNLLQNSPVTPVGLPILFALIFLWGVLMAALGLMASTGFAALGIFAASVAYLFAAVRQFQADGIWYPVITPLFIQAPLAFGGGVLWKYFETNRERQNIRKALSYYVPDEVVDHLAGNIADMRRDGQTAYGVLLFTDCAGYTTVSETMAARELSDFMHRYFEVIFEPVKKHGGLVVDLKGDAVIALWRGAPDDAKLRGQACEAALGVAHAVRRFNESLQTFKLPTRIAIHAGEIFLGNIGAADHYQYGVTGDTVNTASRMDGLNKSLGTDILVSDEVIREVNGFLTREAGSFLFRGKAQPIRVYQLLCRAAEAEECQRKACATFVEGLSDFTRGLWSQARQKFQRSAESFQDDGLSRFYLALCKRYEEQSPGVNWKGFVELEEK